MLPWLVGVVPFGTMVGVTAAAASDARWDGVGGWIDSLAGLQPETRAAFGWAATNGHWELAGRIVGALGAFWHRAGGQSDAMAWAVEVRSHLDEMSVPTRGRVLTAHGLLSWHRDDQASVRRSWVESLQIHDDAGDAPRTAEALALLAIAELDAPGRHGQASTSLDRAVELAREVGAPGLLWEVLNVRGEFLRATGDDADARRSYEEAASIAERIGDDASLSISLANLSYLACHDGRFEEGRDVARRALVLCWALGRRLLSAWSVSELAGPACGLGEHELAARLIGASERAMEALDGHRYPADVAEHERVVGDVLAALGRDRFERLRAEGACLTLDEAVALALGE
ncbi:MAG TPA: tetratricopeptide repeat protein [Acidimicrobiia bacterium]|nr:tetratricopeptide repeat protein [Acidimicrobiia bacterium]